MASILLVRPPVLVVEAQMADVPWKVLFCQVVYSLQGKLPVIYKITLEFRGITSNSYLLDIWLINFNYSIINGLE